MVATRHVHKFLYWMQHRSPQYIVLRLMALLRRYSLSAGKAQRRTEACVQFLADYDCHPTFPTPGRVVRRHGQYFSTLQQLGAEFAVHGYDHVDFRSLTEKEARRQFELATRVYQQEGLRYSGFRCPYLSYDQRVRTSIPDGMFRYSSNRAVWWDVIPTQLSSQSTAIFESLKGFYRADPADVTVSMPTCNENLVEIPVSLPDDLQLFDGLKLGEQGMIQPWLDILHLSHQRGEMFVLLFHPESFHHCRLAFERVLREAQRLQPAVWITQLHEISEWWREKSQFSVAITSSPSQIAMRFDCSERATILVRSLDLAEQTEAWHDKYRVFKERVLQVEGDRRPFIGLLNGVPDETRVFLEEQGYLVETGDQAKQCSIQLDAASTRGLNQVQLIEHIETKDAPLVRFCSWPSAYRSALCVSGDLDALSITDYLARLLPW